MQMSVWIPVLVSMTATTLLVHFSAVAFPATNWPAMGEIVMVSLILWLVLYMCGVLLHIVNTLTYILVCTIHVFRENH